MRSGSWDAGYSTPRLLGRVVASESFRIGLQTGDGLVARFDSAVVVLGVAPGSEPFATALLTALDAAAGTPAPQLAWRVAELLLGHRTEAPPFGLLLALPDHYQLMLHGPARATFDGTEVLGTDASTWVDRRIPAPATAIAVSLATQGPIEADPRSDLRAGTASGAGFVLRRPATSGDGGGIPTDSIRAPAGTPPPDDLPPPPPPAPPRPPVDETIALTERFTALVADNGSRTLLDRPYVFGREPQQDRSVAAGEASPVRFEDPEHLISRIQAYVFVDGLTVTVQDAGSANGTFLSAPGAAEWTRLGSEPARLPVGWSIRMGRRVLTHVDIGV
jgi:hypothetical protein